MPQIEGGPQALNSLLERVYSECMKTGYKDETKCSKASWSAASNAGWHKDKNGKWKKKSIEINLTESLIKQCLALSESGMGWQKVDVYLKDGTILRNRVVIGSKTLIADENEHINVEKIDKIMELSIGKTFGFKPKAEGV